MTRVRYNRTDHPQRTARVGFHLPSGLDVCRHHLSVWDSQQTLKAVRGQAGVQPLEFEKGGQFRLAK